MTTSLADIFGADGPLTRALPDFRVRRSQRLMAERVAEAIEERATLIVEAGTGTGKTFAYLIPALLAGTRVLVSTGTRTLQDQLFAKDLPLLAAALGRPARVALLKGRSNYLCRHRLELNAGEGSAGGEPLALLPEGTGAGRSGELRERIARWALTTRSGDLAEVRELSDAHPLWAQVTSTRDNCLGTRCPQLARCHVVAARREALEADLVIVNHHLLLADLALKEDGFGDLLGSADAVILDEAHQIPELATQFFGSSIGSRQVENLLKEGQAELSRLLAEGSESSQACVAAAAARAAVEAIERGLAELGAVLPARPGRFAWTDAGSEIGERTAALARTLRDFAARVAPLDALPTSASLAERAAELAHRLEAIGDVDELEGTRALERSARGFGLSLVPFDISQRFRELVHGRRCAWIFTSATLSVGEDFGHFAGRLGLQDAPTLKIDSPFDYESQSLLLLPPGMPEPASAPFLPAVVELAVELLRASGGGAFLLFTSHRALAQGAALLRARWSETGLSSAPLIQGEAPRERLLADFRADGHAVLLGTTSFWEGVDVKGEALRLVIIEKLPFASPDDPIVRARIEHLRSSGGNAFRDYQLPEAALMLKQGAGRLIRSETDHGAVVVCDPRLRARAYGRVFLAALPPMPVTQEVNEALRFLRRLAPPAPGTAARRAPA